MSHSARPRAAVLVVHGPNLNLLGEREPEIYGSTSLAELNATLVELGAELGVGVTCHQANSEGAIIDLIQSVRTDFAGLVINPGGFSHTSIAIHDAIRALRVPTVEVHLSNLYTRESFRHASVTGGACTGVIMGLGVASYHLALRHLAAVLAR
jgi:3-dehydroquinate dehydratase-2